MTINNNGIYNAALQGSSGGVQDERWLSNTDASSYSGIQAQIVAFATAIDTAIAFDASITDADCELMQSICQAVTGKRFINSSSDLSILANSVAAFWTRMKGSLQPSTPTPTNNLSTVLYADHGQTASGNGSIGAPFKTIQEAVTAAIALAVPIATIYVAPGTYTGNLDCTGFTGNIIGMTGEFGVDGIGNITSDSPLLLQNINVSKVTSTSALAIYDTNVNGNAGVAVDGNTLRAVSTSGQDTANLTGSVTLTGSGRFINIAGADLTCAGCFAENSTFFNVTLTGNATFNDCDLQRVTSTLNVTLNNCNVSGGTPDATVQGENVIANNNTFESDVIGISSVTLTACSFSECHSPNGTLSSCTGNVLDINDAGGVFEVMGTILTSVTGAAGAVLNWDAYSAGKVSGTNINSNVTPTVVAPNTSITVNVPALAANAIGTTVVALTGTFFENLPAAAIVAANAPAAGVAGGGFLADSFVSSANHITYVFHGPTTGGNQNFPTVRLA